MKRRGIKRSVACGLILAILLNGNHALAGNFSVSASSAGKDMTETVDADIHSAAVYDRTSASGEDGYGAYIREHENANSDVPEFTVEVTEQVLTNMENASYTQSGEYDSDEPAVLVEEGGTFEMTFHVSREGLYTIGVDYYPLEGRGQDIKQAIMIDGAYPFEEARQFVFSRVWKDEHAVMTDSDGNDLYPGQVQAPEWMTGYLRDSNGYYTEPLLFYLTEGEHSISFTSVEEPIVIRSVQFAPEKEILSYEDVLEDYLEAGYSVITDYFDKRQAEDMDKKSSAMLSAVADRSDPAVEPCDGAKIKLNTLGGGRFDTNGMWVEYTVDVPSDGLYRLVFKAKQDNMREQSAYRTIYINGEIPFAEAVNFPFEYSSNYENIVFGSEENPYLVLLKQGENTIRLEASLGDISDFCQRLESSLEVLNALYRKIVTITGTTPDANRDYSLDSKMPDVIAQLEEQYGILSEISAQMKERYDKNTSYTAAIDTLVLLVGRMYKNHYDIPANVSAFHSNLSTLGSKVEAMKQTDLTLDYIMVAGTEEELPEPMAGFLQQVTFSFNNFINSFFTDYSMIGSTEETDTTIVVWTTGGREQAQILKQIINSDFTPNSGIGVDVKLVSDVATLQKAVMTGDGPDVAIGITQTDAMDFAFRGATLDVSEFEDFEEVSHRFAESAIDVLTYQDGVMGIPMTMDFPVLFYREDILEDLGVQVPQTWDDIYALLPVLAQNNMTFGLPMSSPGDTSTSKASVNSFGTLLYQRGGRYYSEDLLSSTFSDNLTINTMADWSDLYISNGLPVSYNFVNRFAAGDMPIAVQNFSSYGTLVLYSPQLADDWSWTTVPGTIQEDGSIDHSTPITVNASIILSDTEQRDASWEFIKWWSSTDVQAEFGRTIENLMGKAGRYTTANLEAMEQISWSGKLYNALAEQAEWTVAVPEIPGGYYMSRNLDNAFREIYNNSEEDSAETRKVMYEYDRVIDNELVYQREALKKAADHEESKQ